MEKIYSKYQWASINEKTNYEEKTLIDTFGNGLITIGHYRTEKPNHWQIALDGRLNYIFTAKEINKDFLDSKKLMSFVETRLEEYFSKALIK